MAGISSTNPLVAVTDGLAVRPGAVVRSAAMSVDPEAKLARAKSRLYVLCQTVGWGTVLVLQLFVQHVVDKSPNRLHDDALMVMVILMGWLLTHAVRPLIHRWNWKQLGWAALVPRAVGLAVAMSVVWSAAGFGYIYLILQEPWTQKFSPLLAAGLSVFNGIVTFVAWFCLYFVYHTFERLRLMQLEQLRLAGSVKEAELRALKSQVNPHFLFNSLNSLRALIDEDAPRARESVTRLANMLRYSLQSGQQETVALEDELRVVADYLALEQIRHEDRLRVRWELENEGALRLLPIPPMLLQTLVENAVKYGISPRREGGEIVIGARVDGAALHLRVTNPGDLSQPASAAAARAGSSTGVGLRNASDRLKLVFGDRTRLTLLSEPPGCVTADVYIPLNPPAR
jgi:hypothetical protein